MSDLALFLLGPPRIELDGLSVHIPRHKAVALLAYLAVTGQTHRRDALATLFWPEHDQSSARAGLRRELAALREALGESWLDADRESVNLNWDAGIELDVCAFRQRLAGCQIHSGFPREDCAACLSLLTEAADLYGGDLMAGFTLRDSPAFDDWQFFETQSLRDELAGALERLVKGQGARGEVEQAIAYARRWLSLDPLHEPAHRALMELYAWSGQRAAALRQYDECARLLADELGVSPEEETVALHQAIVEHSELPSPVQGAVAVESDSVVRLKHNLPAQLTPFVGRAGVLDQIAARLDDSECRLLTLVGPGGSGKTRLALEAAARRLDEHEHGIFFVSLSPFNETGEIVPAIAQALGFSFHGEGEAKAQLLRYLREKNLLLLLDNTEHLPDAGTIATDILRAAPQVMVLVTSRAGLHVQGEQRFPVEGMEVPEEKSDVWQTSDFWGRYSAVKLFVQGARRVQPDFELTDQNAADVIRICRLVEGMPLSILLAAAWANTLTPAEIADEVARGLDFLETDWRDVPARQRSLRAVYNHSWSLLDESQREVLGKLSVFRGGFTREAAQQVAGASLRQLTALVDRSLLHRTPGPSTVLPSTMLRTSRTGGRYEMHELVRQYAAERLAESPETERQVRDRHAAHYAAAVQAWGEALKGAGQLEALAEIEADLGNTRLAWDWAVEHGQVQELGRAMDGLCHFYEWRGRYEEGDAACRAVANMLQPRAGAAQPDVSRLWARATAWRGVFSYALRRLEQSKHLLTEALACLEDLASAGHEVRREKAFALWQMGQVLERLGDLDCVEQHYEESLVLYRALNDRWGTATVSSSLSNALRLNGTDALDRGLALVQEGLALQQEMGDQRGAAASLRVLAVLAHFRGQDEESDRLARESVAAFQALGDRAHTAEAMVNLGVALRSLGRLIEARLWMAESVAIHRDLGFGGPSFSYALSFLSTVDAMLGHYDQASVSAQAALDVEQQQGSRQIEVFVAASNILGAVAIAKGEYALAEQILQQYSIESEPPPISLLGFAACGLGQTSLARQRFCTAWRASIERIAERTTEQDGANALYFLVAIACLFVHRGEAERAIELYALALCGPPIAYSRWHEDVVGRHVAAAAASLPPDVVAAAQERGRARNIIATAKELLAELEAEMEEENSS